MCLTASYVTKANSAICQCACCIGHGCTPVAKPPVFIPSCVNGACGLACTTTFPDDCAVAGSIFTGSCFSGASAIINHHGSFMIFGTVFALFVKQIS